MGAGGRQEKELQVRGLLKDLNFLLAPLTYRNQPGFSGKDTVTMVVRRLRRGGDFHHALTSIFPLSLLSPLSLLCLSSLSLGDGPRWGQHCRGRVGGSHAPQQPSHHYV